jgi:hypothetical protein
MTLKVGKYIPPYKATEAFVRSGAVYDNAPVMGAVSGSTVVIDADKAMDMNIDCDIDKAIENIQKSK